MYEIMVVELNSPQNKTFDAIIWKQIQNDNTAMKQMTAELKSTNNRLQL